MEGKGPGSGALGAQLRSAVLMGTSPSTSGAAGPGQHGHPAWLDHFITIHTTEARLRSGSTRPLCAKVPTPLFQGHQWGRDKARGPLPHPSRALAGCCGGQPPPTPSAPGGPERSSVATALRVSGPTAHMQNATSQLRLSRTVWLGVSASCRVLLGKSIQTWGPGCKDGEVGSAEDGSPHTSNTAKRTWGALTIVSWDPKVLKWERKGLIKMATGTVGQAGGGSHHIYQPITLQHEFRQILTVHCIN